MFYLSLRDAVQSINKSNAHTNLNKCKSKDEEQKKLENTLGIIATAFAIFSNAFMKTMNFFLSCGMCVYSLSVFVLVFDSYVIGIIKPGLYFNRYLLKFHIQ